MNEAQMVEALGALVGERVYPDTAGLNETLPFILWQQVGGKASSYFEGGTPDKKNARIQISVMSSTRLESKLLIVQVEQLLTETPFFGDPLGAAVAGIDEPTGIRQMRQDFSLSFEYP